MKTNRNIFKEACVLLTILIMFLSTVVVTANNVNNLELDFLFEENFEEGIMPPTGWNVTGNEWSISTDAMYGNYSAKFYDPTHSKTADLILPVLEFEDVIKVNISFWFKNPDGLDTLSLSVSYGGPWYPIAEYSDPVEQYSLDCVINEVYFGILKIKFTAVSGGGEGIYLDYIIVSDKAPNYPPFAPTIKGQVNGKPNREYDYKFMSIDPEEDKITYCINWGDETEEVEIGRFQSGLEVSAKHTYSKGNYIIKAKARDDNGVESDWSTLAVNMPKTRVYNQIIQLFMERLRCFPLFGKILNQ